jgi:hypothetical protein
MAEPRKKPLDPLYIRARRLLQQAKMLEDFGQFSPENIAAMRKIADFGYVPDEEVRRACSEMRSSLNRARAQRRNTDGKRRGGSGDQRAEASSHSDSPQISLQSTHLFGSPSN